MLERASKEERVTADHERELQLFTTRNEPLGKDRFNNVYWRFAGWGDCLLVQQPVTDSSSSSLSLSLPSSHSFPSLSSLCDPDPPSLVLIRSKPSQQQYTWGVYSSVATIWSLVLSLDERGEREKKLKAVIKASFGLRDPPLVYLKTGSPYLGRSVRRLFSRKVICV